MDSLDTFTSLVTQGCYTASIDLEDAYNAVRVHPSDRKYLRFRYEGKLYQFTCLPNGLSSAPRIFTKITKVVYATLREKGINCVGYIDDSGIVGIDAPSCKSSVLETKSLFERLGFTLNKRKSQLEPSQKLKFLGFWIDSKEMSVNMDREKASCIIDIGTKILKADHVKIQTIAVFIGKVVAALPAVEIGKIFYRSLELEKIKAIRENNWNFESHMSVGKASKDEITWWIKNIPDSKKDIVKPAANIVMQTDASLEGWGAVCGPERANGRWLSTEKEYHIYMCWN